MAASTQTNAERTVLIVDPEMNEFHRLTEAFLGSPWDLVPVDGPQQAERLLRRGRYLAVISSLAHCEEIRTIADRAGSKVRIVAAVGFGEELGPSGGIPSWPFAVLRKPYAPNEVRQILNFAWAAWRHTAMLGVWSMVA
jgi:hypothetical protein